MGWADGEINNAPFKYADVNGVDNTGNAIQFVNNIDGGNILTIHGGSMSGSPQIVYTSVSPAYDITNGDIVYEDAGLSSPFDGDDTFYWNDPSCTTTAFVAYADIDNDGELSNRACLGAESFPQIYKRQSGTIIAGPFTFYYSAGSVTLYADASLTTLVGQWNGLGESWRQDITGLTASQRVCGSINYNATFKTDSSSNLTNGYCGQ